MRPLRLTFLACRGSVNKQQAGRDIRRHLTRSTRWLEPPPPLLLLLAARVKHALKTGAAGARSRDAAQRRHAPAPSPRTLRPGTLRLRLSAAAALKVTGLLGWGPATSLPESSK